MASYVVIRIQTNPKESHRPCEGIRIALGLAACNLKVDMILAGDAPRLLTDDIEECVDGEMAKLYLSNLIKFIPTFYIEDNLLIVQNEYSITFLSRDAIAKKIATAECFIQF